MYIARIDPHLHVLMHSVMYKTICHQYSTYIIISMKSALTTELTTSTFVEAVVDAVDGCFGCGPLPLVSLCMVTVVSNTLYDDNFDIFVVLTL